MSTLFLFLAVLGLCASKLCQSKPPTVSLLEEMRMCRELNFPFCVEASAESLLALQKTIPDLPNDIIDSSLTEVSAMAVVADRYLTQRYKKLVAESDPSQTCLHHWRMAVCSEIFSALGSPTSLCYSTCQSVKEHCTAQFLTSGCEETLQYGGPTSGQACTDYASLVYDDACVIGDGHNAADSDNNQPQQPLATKAVPSQLVDEKPVVALPGGGNGGGARPDYYETSAEGSRFEVCATMQIVLFVIAVLNFEERL